LVKPVLQGSRKKRWYFSSVRGPFFGLPMAGRCLWIFFSSLLFSALHGGVSLAFCHGQSRRAVVQQVRYLLRSWDPAADFPLA
jgi:hypothetical protein